MAFLSRDWFFSLLGVFMFLRGRDMEAENSKLLNISDRFVDHEALFSQEVNKDLLEQLQQRERQYRLIAHSRRGGRPEGGIHFPPYHGGHE